MISLRYRGTVDGYRRLARPKILRAAMRGWRLADEARVAKLQQELDRAGEADSRSRQRGRRK